MIEKNDSITSANTRRYYYNYNWQILSEFDGSGGYKKSYIYGNYIDEVLMSVVSAIESTHKYYLHDHLSSPVALTDNDGVVVERYEYDAYGKCYILEPNFAPDPDGKPDVGNPFMFTGRETDFLDNGNLKIMNYRHRYYDTYTGRFTTHDPLGIDPTGGINNPFALLQQYTDDLNLYQYTHDNPVINSDSMGLTLVPIRIPPAKCCKIKERKTVRILCRFGTCIPVDVPSTSCTQTTIYSECPAWAACCAAYKDRSNIEVYKADEGECCWCKLYYVKNPQILGHAYMYVQCDQGRGEWAADLMPDSITAGTCFIGTSVPVNVDDVTISDFASGAQFTYKGHVSCDAADRWRAEWEGKPCTWALWHNCWFFADGSIRRLKEECP
jgi:RHS repeat-associated protein